jgi:hypothetical protein
MKETLKNILDKSGKKTTISYENKEIRKSFDEKFGVKKMDLAAKIIGDNSIILSKKLASI